MTVWYRDGRVARESMFREDRLNGEHRSWWEDGKPREEGVNEDGERTGPWRVWRADGSVDEEASGTYERGVKLAPH